ncbi:MAG: Sec-independent protein translocase protein TatB [Methylococcaceae bacterium]|nr:Sec-independent protein translocase protein TatB [Methylococcaceae bacterium]
MFDVGFTELLLVGLVALLVFGPERLPRVAREAALWIRKARSAVSSVKEEIDRELQLQEMRESLEKQKREMNRMMLESRNDGDPAPEEKPPAPESHHE